MTIEFTQSLYATEAEGTYNVNGYNESNSVFVKSFNNYFDALAYIETVQENNI